jgi:hypothetical protein
MLVDIDNRRQQAGEEAVEAIQGQCYFFEMSCKENRNVHHPLYMLAGMIDRMVESLVQKRVPIPRAKPRLADATPSSVLSRSNEMRAEAKARAKAAAAAAAEAAAALAAEVLREGKNSREEKLSREERDIEDGKDGNDTKDTKDGKEEKDEKDNDEGGEGKGFVAEGPSNTSPKLSRTVAGDWWENSPYIKKVGDECILQSILNY